MQKRRSHKKSRNGCQNCKKWHTKCDESGPPCNNCALRKAKCIYNNRANPGHSDSSSSLTIRSNNRDRSTSSTLVERPPGDVGTICGAYGGPSRLLELELMHQWSTNTFKAFRSIPEDGEYLQVMLPRAALNYDFMLNCILSISSLQIAWTMGDHDSAAKYVNAGLEYYNRGSMSFRTALQNINSDNCHVLYMFSAIAIAAHLTIPRRGASTLELLITALDLIHGSTSIGMLGMPWLLNSAFPLRLFVERMGAPKELIDEDSKAALARLHAINDKRHEATPEPEIGIREDVARDVEVHDHQLYRMALAALEMSFAEESKGELRGFCTAFPALVGRPFTSLIGRHEPFALLIALHWTVLLGGLDKTIWWANSISQELAEELVDVLKTSHPDLALEWTDSIAWALDRVRLTTSRPQQLSGSNIRLLD
ncbi:hypothetical protein M426DRAFT_77273 [Hypoxylon sp. CI-4A]|nr:hypothetical protein M426DRAFT_77273 [Hypoxylon sp. CI-4A]